MTVARGSPAPELAAAASALIVVDVQNDFCHPEGAIGRDVPPATVKAMCASIDALHSAAGRAGVPVVFVQTIHRHATDSRAWRSRDSAQTRMVCRVGTWGAEFHLCLPRAGDVVVEKHRYSAFHGTELQHVLRAAHRSTVVLVGTATNVCVESTARDAVMLDYDVVVVEDATCAATEPEHAAALFNIRRYFGRVADTASVVEGWELMHRAPPSHRRAVTSWAPGWQSPFYRERR